jgi:hypothetical protein
MSELRFHNFLEEEIANPDPRGNHVLTMRSLIARFVQNIRRKNGWNFKSAAIPLVEIEEETDSRIFEVIAELIAYHREHAMVSRVTENAAYRVLNKVRAWVLRQQADSCRLKFMPQEEVDRLASTYLFSSFAEEKVKEFDEWHQAGVIDQVEYYFLLGVYKRYPIRKLAGWIKWKDATARTCIFYARKKVRAYIEAGHLPPKTGRPRQIVDENLLMRRLQKIIES